MLAALQLRKCRSVQALYVLAVRACVRVIRTMYLSLRRHPTTAQRIGEVLCFFLCDRALFSIRYTFSSVESINQEGANFVVSHIIRSCAALLLAKMSHLIARPDYIG